MIDVTISLVSHNQRDDLERLLPGLMLAAKMVPCEVLLVDNESIDGSLEFVQQCFPVVKVISNPHKAGYGENHNLNLARARGRFFGILNSDMTVEQNVFRSLLGFMDQHPDVGIVSPKVLNEDGSIQGLNKRYPTVFDLLLRRFCDGRFQHLFRRRLDSYEMRDVGYDHTYDVPFLSGAFMFCRADLLTSLGGFDPEYFLYFEDVDLCRRVQRTHRTVYYPEVAVVHFWERSAHKDWRYTAHFVRSATRYFHKWGYRLF